LTLLFIPAAGSARAEWVFQTQHFKDSEVVVLPGHPEGKPLPTINGYVEWLRGYIQRKQYRDIVLAGHSMGGAIVLLYALKYGSELKGIVLIGTGARLRVLPARLKMLEAVITAPAGWRRVLDYEFRFVAPQVREALIGEGVGIGAAIVLNDHLACDKFDIMDKFHLINVPALIICGQDDDRTPVKYSDYLASKMPKAKKVIIDGGDHWVHLEKPAEVNWSIQDFLDSLN
jgi:pimeloyl-ACP methyl ester carboxylesterase